jgi:hypothetical protein
MALNSDEQLLVEAITSMLSQDAKLGLSNPDQEEPQKVERGFAYLHEQIEDMFAVRAAELTHAESVTRAFRKVHGYKYLDDWTFPFAMEKEMVTQAVPIRERKKALEFIPKIVEELQQEQQVWSERDAGFNPKLDEVRKVSQPKQPTDFKIQDRSLNKRNVDKTERGDASPARTNLGKPPVPDDGHDPETDPGDGAGN